LGFLITVGQFVQGHIVTPYLVTAKAEDFATTSSGGEGLFKLLTAQRFDVEALKAQPRN